MWAKPVRHGRGELYIGDCIVYGITPKPQNITRDIRRD